MNSYLIENLMNFGLSRQEALIYVELIKLGQSTGYEISKITGISRSNVYSSLSELVNKGAAVLSEGETAKYDAVNPEEFLSNVIRTLSDKKQAVLLQLPSKKETEEGYITVKGFENIKNKIRVMLDNTEKRLYFMASKDIISIFSEELKNLAQEKKKIVILSDGFKISGAKVYETECEEGQVRLITDSLYVLTGEFNGTLEDTCLYSGKRNLVDVMKEALKNKIVLLEQETKK
ncbi:MAG: TrmB family transcriptional regulator [Treponema sp.]|nr:TrmB family transcriptional regulator [Candidatus Treponema merdequi]